MPECSLTPRRRFGDIPVINRLVMVCLAVALGCSETIDPALDLARGRYAFEQGRWAWARVYLAEPAAAGAAQPEAVKMLAIAWISGGGGSLGRGAELLERYVEFRPQDQPARKLLVKTLLRMGEVGRALAACDGFADDPESLALRARTMVDTDPAEAAELAMRALAQDPDQTDAHSIAARLFESTGDFGAAFGHARMVMELDPFDSKNYNRVIRLGRYRGDVDLVDRSVEAMEIAGRLIQSRDAGQLPLLEELRMVNRLGGLVGDDSAAYRKRRAELLINAGRIDLGLEILGRLQEEDELTSGDVLAFGRRLVDVGRMEEAKRLYEFALELDPENSTAWSSVALCDLALGNHEIARASMSDAVARFPDAAGFHAALGRIELQVGETGASIEHLERALDLAPWEGEWRRLLASVLRSVGEGARAERVASGAPMLPEFSVGTDTDVTAPGDPLLGGEAVGQPWFAEVSHEIGIDFIQYDGRSGERFYVETTASGCGFLDFDDDGDLDVYLLTGAPTPGAPVPADPPRNRLYENRGGRFVDISEDAGVGDDGYGMGMCVGDIDADGLLDFMVTNYGPDRLYRNLGNGRFEEVSEQAGVDDPRWGSNCAFGDIDGDGDLDLYVSHYLHFDFDDNPKCGDNAREIYFYCRPSSFLGVTDSLFINDGAGVFNEQVRSRGIKEGVLEKGFGVVMTDIDLDRDLDIFVANDSTPNRFYVNDGNGVFEDQGLSCGIAVNAEGMTTSGMGVDVADIDGDTLMDIVLTNYSMEPNGLYHNLGNAQFADVAAERGIAVASLPEVGWGVVLADLDNDGDRDVAVANGHVVDNIREVEPSHSYEQTNVLLLNDGEGNFEDVTVESGMDRLPRRVSRSLAVGDWNNDGRLDLLVSNCNDRFELLENRIETDNHWIGLRLQGRLPHRFAIGARVELEIEGGSKQVAEVRSGSSFQAQRDLRLHFGLGEHSGPVSVTVFWPDGSQQVEAVDRIDRYVEIRQSPGN